MAVTALHQWLVPVILSLNQVSHSSPKLCFLIQVTLKLHVNRKDVGCFCLLQYLCALKSCSTCKSHSKHCVLWCWATLADPRKSPLSIYSFMCCTKESLWFDMNQYRVLGGLLIVDKNHTEWCLTQEVFFRWYMPYSFCLFPCFHTL